MQTFTFLFRDPQALSNESQYFPLDITGDDFADALTEAHRIADDEGLQVVHRAVQAA